MIYLKRKHSNGAVEKFLISHENAEISFIVPCGYCGEDIEFDEEEFAAFVHENGLHGSLLFCNEDCCNEYRKGEKV